MALKRLPILNKYGIQTYFNGPESFTPDDKYYLGEVPNLKGFWVAAGYNSIGIASSGGAGMALSHWINDGYPPFDLWDVDIRRAQPFQRNKLYLKDRVTEIPLLAGDVLLVQGTESAISSLKNNSDVVLIDWTRKYLPQKRNCFVLV